MTLRILYAAPGHHLVETCGPTRNLLSVARHLAAEVTVGFRSFHDALPGDLCGVEFDPSHRLPAGAIASDTAWTGLSLRRAWRYVRVLEGWSADHRFSFDCVLEKSWRGSGVLGASFLARGVPYIMVENVPRLARLDAPGLSPRAWLRQLLHVSSELLVVRRMTKASAVIAETPTLRRDLVERLRIPAERVHLAGLGVDRHRFRPLVRRVCRRQLSWPEDLQIWLYVGSFDPYHDLTPCLRAFAETPTPSVRLVVVGDGPDRGRWQNAAGAANGRTVFFPGRVSHEEVPLHIGAADLCLAPYAVDRFPRGEVTFSTLKIREYLACSRPVVSVPGEVTRDLMQDGRNGRLIDNVEEEWRALLSNPPSRGELERLRSASSHLGDWQETADRYLEICCSLATRRDAAIRTSAHVD